MDLPVRSRTARLGRTQPGPADAVGELGQVSEAEPPQVLEGPALTPPEEHPYSGTLSTTGTRRTAGCSRSAATTRLSGRPCVRSYCGVYIDAGYLTAAASIRLTGTSYRAATEVDVASLIRQMTSQATAHADLPLLRVHWYDAGARGVASAEQRRVATLPRVKLRLGRTSVHGEQKGVDLKLALDLITQARNRVTDVVYLASGDDDLTEAVEEAQHLGTQVVLLAVPDLEGRAINVSRNLQMACDDLLLISPSALDEHVRKATRTASVDEPTATPDHGPAEDATAAVIRPVSAPRSDVDEPEQRMTPARLALMLEHRAPAAPPPKRLYTTASTPVYSTATGQPAAASSSIGDDEDAIASVITTLLDSWWPSASAAAKRELLAGRPVVPQELDRTLLLDLSARLGVDELGTGVRFRLRELFWEHAARR